MYISKLSHISTKSKSATTQDSKVLGNMFGKVILLHFSSYPLTLQIKVSEFLDMITLPGNSITLEDLPIAFGDF